MKTILLTSAASLLIAGAAVAQDAEVDQTPPPAEEAQTWTDESAQDAAEAAEESSDAADDLLGEEAEKVDAEAEAAEEGEPQPEA